MTVDILIGDSRSMLAEIPSASVNCCVTSPPYFGLRDYGVAGQIGLELTPDEYVGELVAIFREVRRALRDDGTLWLNLGDSYAASTSGNGGYSASSTLSGFTSPNTKGRIANDAGARRKISHGLKHKDLLGIPWLVAFALRNDGWYLRSDIIWSKPNPMPESVTDRPTSAHEHIFLLAKSERYYFDQDSIKEPAVYFDKAKPESAVYKDARSFDGKHTDKQQGHGRHHAGFNARWDAMEKAEQCGGLRNIRNVWTIATQPYADAHFATFPPSLIEPCVKAGSPVGGTILDPFFGAGTTGLVADRLGRSCIGIELNPAYAALARNRISEDAGMFSQVSP